MNNRTLNLTLSLGLIVTVALKCADLQGATLTAVPMQGGMVMPMISYHASDARLHVMLDPTTPQLAPLMVSHPNDSFAADDPWFVLLDPSRQALAFSRRYGFVMDTMTDPLPAGTSIWLRKLSGPVALGVYRYANTNPKAFEPIFGTAGSPAALAWNGMMFHPTFAAPSGTNDYTATFDAYLADSLTGAEMAGSSTGPFTLTWTTVSDGRPALSIATRIVVTWPVVTGSWALESTDPAEAVHWTPVSATPISFENQQTVLLEPSASSKLYRLRKVP